jgi:hypothetical protein
MTNRQYGQLVQNRRWRQVHPAVDGRVEARFLRGAARDLRRRAAVQRGLERVLPRSWLDVAWVEMVEGGTVIIRVRDAVIGEGMRRDRVRLERELGRAVRGLRRVQISLAVGRA